MESDKWVGKPPLGFTTDDDGYLIANIEFYEAFNGNRDGFYTVERAMEKLENNRDVSYRGLADSMKCSRTALANVYKDEEKRVRYLSRTAEDGRVTTALDELGGIEKST